MRALLSRTVLFGVAALAAALPCATSSLRARAPELPAVAVASAPPPRRAPAPPAPASVAPAPLPLERELARWLARSAEVTVRVGDRGSGTLVSERGEVLTAAHVVDDLSDVSLVLPDGRAARGHVAVRDAAHDLALLTTDAVTRDAPATDCVPVRVTAPELGAWVLVGGFPGPLGHAIDPARSLGLVLGPSTLPPLSAEPTSATRSRSGSRPLPDRAAILSTAHIAPGMSGGPGLDAEGRLVGVAAALGGRLAPLEGSPATEGLSCARRFAPVALGEVILDPQHHEPDRDASLRAHQPAPLARAALGPERMPHPSVVRLHVGLGVYVEGVVVAPDLVLTLADQGLGTLEAPAPDVTLPSHPDAHVLGPVEIEGELALVRVEGLALPALSREALADVRVGSLLEGLVSARLGVVSARDVTPGAMRPFVPTPTGRHCGTIANMRYRASPPVSLDAPLFAHDVMASRGELLVDAHGAPVAMHVGDHVDGVGYAVPLSVALARFSRLATDAR